METCRRYLLPSILVLTTLTAAACSRRVHYVLPDDYVGIIKIVLDEKNGLELKQQNRTYTLEVPEDGVLRLKSFELFDPYHETIFTKKNGTEIPGFDAPDDIIAFRDTIFEKTSGGSTTAITIIGTKKQTEQIREDMANQPFVDVEPAVYNQRFRK